MCSNCGMALVRDTAPPVLGEASPSLLIQKEGDTVDMFCEATATPTPTLTWRKDGRELVSGDHVTIVGQRVRLVGLSAADGGLYTCTFGNSVGTISHHIKLVIQGQSTHHAIVRLGSSSSLVVVV